MSMVVPPCSLFCTKHTACIEAMKIAGERCVCCRRQIGFNRQFHAVPNGYMHYLNDCRCPKYPDGNQYHGITNTVDKDGDAVKHVRRRKY